MAKLDEIWRHPIKGVGREALYTCELRTGETLPYDRTWAILHKDGQFNPGEWARCRNFARAASSPALMAVTCQFKEEDQEITLKHPNMDPLAAHMDNERNAIVAWVGHLISVDRSPAYDVVKLESRGLTDSEFPSVSIMSKASLRALGQRAGFDLAQHRFRGNLWIDDLPAWEEEEWVGRTVRIGEVELNVRERIIRCQAIASNPTTGKRDFDTLSHLETARRTPEFGVNAEITKPGKISLNDVVEVF